ncbi:SRPBCC family protein [Saccharopolyspora gloriosae]|uniref:SRPBCC family protein n=1 Tax=Saccharopolyspora gloriosae TaxID=455344 RepID=UPI001FB6BDC9|nr:SRPBCC family protein [Saccharopolyspora gloriosae]
MEWTGARLADRPTTEVRTWIAAAPEQVWPVVSDIERLPEASSELHAVEWLDGASGPVLGARFRGHNRNDVLGEWATTSHVIECDPGRAFAWAVQDPAEPNATWRFVLAPKDGGTELAYRVRIGPGRSGLTMAVDRMPDKEQKIIYRRLCDLAENMDATLEHLKRRIERTA